MAPTRHLNPTAYVRFSPELNMIWDAFEVISMATKRWQLMATGNWCPSGSEVASIAQGFRIEMKNQSRVTNLYPLFDDIGRRSPPLSKKV